LNYDRFSLSAFEGLNMIDSENGLDVQARISAAQQLLHDNPEFAQSCDRKFLGANAPESEVVIGSEVTTPSWSKWFQDWSRFHKG
jgi:hypothetical protein